MEDNEKAASVHFSSASNTWDTPDEFYQKLNAAWNFTLDPAAMDETAKCNKYYTPETDGLSHSWNGETVWCNPPYGREIKNWYKKFDEEFKQNGTTIVALPPARTDTIYFHKYVKDSATAICFVKGRLKFDNRNLPLWTEEGSHKKNGAPFPSMIVIYDNDLTNEKIKVLQELGLVVRPW
ncbi:prophage LambdaSo, DNA modification methyltransferase, putative [Yersinia phage fHe-Yen9-04]|uniref:Prophage LambdaSo, DNA modification methyltransferase, putative n=2 Tax=Eneladusvirus Yen904 TaxID=2560849 RepID=A0A2C9CWW2_9CAUD|nr:DNA methyltransferase [Yersinia phage fHe-Yen9-04]SOK58327.1 prophage LambdaSo, DNA modification methyltransferase, putative [Yersinia phage fHe-Yen9-04]SOK58864.1 prophage LambdaSo, DNA modification methyltransferase, putative [Yersinia phage fHe-Yen9-03]VUE36096.1 prophage LambdaSo, DNA modification methyltransferase, putative [Yersinia phage fHe-Yen9-04]